MIYAYLNLNVGTSLEQDTDSRIHFRCTCNHVEYICQHVLSRRQTCSYLRPLLIETGINVSMTFVLQILKANNA